jgi:hypothetical protein
MQLLKQEKIDQKRVHPKSQSQFTKIPSQSTMVAGHCLHAEIARALGAFLKGKPVRPTNVSFDQ